MMREKFPIFRSHPDLIYLDSAATAQKPQEVIDALTQFYSSEYATVHRTVYRGALVATEKYNAARETVRRFLNAKEADEIVFTRGTTDALNLVAKSFGMAVLKAGDEILITEMEHHSNIVPWQMIAAETGAILRVMPVDERGVLLWENQITAKTKIIALAHVSNVLGTINPIEEIAKAARKEGAYVVVDGAQAAPHMPVDVQKLGCDFYAFSGHKCYGPTGIGALFGKRERLEMMAPIEGGGDMIERVEFEKTSYQKPPLRFEAGTPIIASAIALKTALDFIESIGREKIAAHGEKLMRHAEKKLLEIPGLKIIGTAPHKGPILAFSIQGAHPLDIATLLDLKQIAVRSGHLCAQPLLRRFGLESAVRASFGIYNTEEEANLFALALTEIVLCFL